jgi:hypothetical protein
MDGTTMNGWGKYPEMGMGRSGTWRERKSADMRRMEGDVSKGVDDEGNMERGDDKTGFYGMLLLYCCK